MSENKIQQSPARKVTYFLVFLLAFTSAVFLLTSRMQGTPIASLLIMLTPTLAAILASILTRRSFKEMGWELRPVKWLGVGWVIPILYGFMAYIPLWLTGLGGVPNPTFLERARLTLNMPTGSDALVILSAFGFISIVNLLPAMLMSLGEEIGWRGFLVPELSKWIGFRKASLLSGVVWGAWHLPGIYSGEYGFADTPLAFRLICFAAMVLFTGVIFAWLRTKSGSLWPVVIMHAVHNNIIQAFFERITFDTGYTNYFTGEFGLALVISTLIIGWLCWLQLGGIEKEKVSNLQTQVNIA
jgi:membrane protease YdiL (CAAX protease family)